MNDSTRSAKPGSSVLPTATLDRDVVASPKSPAQIGPIHELICQRAYAKWLKRGRQANSSLQDWFDAEKEIKAEMRAGRKT
jgi:hypothetical protein